ncbi:MAG: Hpt domain-containing protein [Desulfovibrionaceae bacterium]|nr:Hpt domain-containing protein [Desulfovibrionaceae bacterium]
MSQEFMDPELFADFIVEAKEHLETIEPNLLELEKNPGNLSLLNEIFRPMHSLKGASGFLGLNNINGLAHKAENILDELRKGNMRMTAEIMDVILAATDGVRTMIDSLETSGVEGAYDTAPAIARIEAILSGHPAPTAPAAPADPFESVVNIGLPAETPAEPDGLAAVAALTEPAESAEPVSQTAQPAPQAAAPEPDATGAEEEYEEFPPNPDFDSTPYVLTSIGEGHLNDFMEEAREIIENLNRSLLELEHTPEPGELVNDIFRYFHNLKGNSGILGYKELNALTHEAETLLNKVRKGEITSNQAMVDMLLGVVDLIESLVGAIDTGSNLARPLDIAPVVGRLRKAVETGKAPAVRMAGTPKPPSGASGETGSPAPPVQPVQPGQPGQPGPEAGAGEKPLDDPENIVLFKQTVSQQLENIELALATLRSEPSNKDAVDGLYRSLNTIQHSTGYMGFNEHKTYAERTAGLVDGARKADLPFDAMQDILEQECSILGDMLRKLFATLESAENVPDQPDRPAQAAIQPPAATALETKAPPQAAPPKPEPAPAQPATAPKPAAAAPAKPAAAPKPAAPAAKPVPPISPSAPASPVAPVTPVTPVAPGAPAAEKPKVSSTIRVDHEKLDHLMNLIGELIINRNRYTLLARSLEEGKTDVQHIAQQLTETTYAMARISDDLQDTIMKVRMVPVSTVFSRFPRLVRDLSRKIDKEINLIMEGEETELDKSVVEVIGDPLVHLIRNSVDHGLEPEQERLASGKQPIGKVFLRAYHRGNSVAIEVEDDGRGIDPVKMREVAVRKNVISPEEAKNLDDQEAVELIFAPGFSSAEKVTDISGRGVGMDVVRTNIKNLKGTVSVSSVVGKGSKFTLALPLTLAIIDALMVSVDNATYAIPLDSVSETTKIEVTMMTEINKRKAITLRGEVLGLIELSEVLEIPKNNDAREILPVVILQDNQRRIGLIVDRLLERQEIVIKPLGTYLSEFDMRGISGATIMGDGSVVLILDPHEIYLMCTGGGRRPESETKETKPKGKGRQRGEGRAAK